MSRPAAGAGAEPSPERQLEIARDLLARTRRELNFYRVLACGFLVVSFLAAWGVGRTIVMGGFLLVGLVGFFLNCLWGLDDHEMPLGQALGMTFALAIGALLLMWLGGLL
jgi:hypothetical protein